MLNKTVKLTTDGWELVTSAQALLQFNDAMYMYLGGATAPTDTLGLVMEKNEKYVNNSSGIYIWAKKVNGVTSIPSIRVVEM